MVLGSAGSVATPTSRARMSPSPGEGEGDARPAVADTSDVAVGDLLAADLARRLSVVERGDGDARASSQLVREPSPPEDAVPPAVPAGLVPDVLFLDDPRACADALGPLIERAEPVAVDFEGVALSRTGKLCLAQVAPASGPVLLLDISVMGAAAFARGRLRELLEHPTLLKLIFDCRNDSDALRHQFGVHIRAVYDVQVVYCLKRDQDNGGRRGAFLCGLQRALGDCPGLGLDARAALEEVKNAGKLLFAPEAGGGYDAWERRPMHPDLLAYAAADVVHLHAMWKEWKHFMGQGKMDETVAKRIKRHAKARDAQDAGGKPSAGSRRDF